MTPAQRRAYWEAQHGEFGFRKVCSVAEDAREQDRILAAMVDAVPDDPRIFVPGCGSRGALERRLVSELPGSHVTAVDFPAVVSLAQSTFSHSRVDFVSGDIAEFSETGAFDVTIAVNSVVSESDAENRRILRQCCRSLRDGGLFIGYFPTIFSPLEIALLSGDTKRASQIDLRNSTYFEAGQGAYQIFYTPLRLRVALREAGFILERMEVAFLDSPGCFGHGEPWRDPDDGDEDLLIYELFVVARPALRRP